VKLRTYSADFLSLIVYQSINTLFVYKYATRFLSCPWLWLLGYLIAINALLILFYRDFDFKLGQKPNATIFVVCVVFTALLLTLIMLRFEPAKIRVGRFPALMDWIARLLSGEYPYASPTLPSGFPFLFFLAMPFYFLGDLGWLQIFAFLVFAFILQLRYGSDGTRRLRTLILLVVSPVFVYEIAVRSDLFSNMVVVILYMFFCLNKVRDRRIPVLFVTGLAGGFLLATRGIVLLIYVLYFGYLFKHQLKRGLIFIAGIISGFSIVCLPFAIWNVEYFTLHGPFAIQSAYLPDWLSVLFLLLGIYLARRAPSMAVVYRYTALTLFAAVFIAFCISLLDQGWPAAVMADRFDISYFCFALPFLLLSLDYERRPV
jgi:hypothetical protein